VRHLLLLAGYPQSNVARRGAGQDPYRKPTTDPQASPAAT
jgi:hypothetical protein